MSERNPCLYTQDELSEGLQHLCELGVPAEVLGLIEQASQEALAPQHDSRMSDWSALIEALPALHDPSGTLSAERLYSGHIDAEWAGREPSEVEGLLKGLKPWRKGPIQLGPTFIDTEWRSDWKWARVATHVELEGRRALDVGGGNGYYGWRMLEAGAQSALVIDPTRQFFYQHLTLKRALRHLLSALGARAPLHLPLTLEAFRLDEPRFEVVFSMGVLYHRRDPQEHLSQLMEHLRPGGQLVLETLVHEGEGLLELGGRYANMRNIWALPSVPLLCAWLEEAGFSAPRCVDLTWTSCEEQRRTEWMSFYSLAEALDPHEPRLTVEGHPAPLRATITCQRA